MHAAGAESEACRMPVIRQGPGGLWVFGVGGVTHN